jgi:hypothetical protein
MSRIGEVVELLEAFALGEVDLPRERVMAAVRLLDLMVPNAALLDDGAEVLMSVDDQARMPRSPDAPYSAGAGAGRAPFALSGGGLGRGSGFRVCTGCAEPLASMLGMRCESRAAFDGIGW